MALLRTVETRLSEGDTGEPLMQFLQKKKTNLHPIYRAEGWQARAKWRGSVPCLFEDPNDVERKWKPALDGLLQVISGVLKLKEIEVRYTDNKSQLVDWHDNIFSTLEPIFWETQKKELELGFGDAWYPFKWQKSSDLTKIAALGASAAAATGAAAYLYKREKR